MRRLTAFSSIIISGLLVFSGCATDTEAVISESEVVASLNETVTETVESEPIEEIEEEKETIVIEPDNSYIYEDLCKVNAEYDETAGGAPIDVIIKELRKESCEGMVLLSHTVEGDKDTVKYKLLPKNISGKGRPYIICSAEFIKDGEEWVLTSKEWSEWIVKSNEISSKLCGSSWVANSTDVKDLEKLFESGFTFDKDSKVYVHFKKTFNRITVLSNDDASVFETRFGANYEGTIYCLNEDGNKSIDFTCTEGIVNDDGLLSFKLVTNNGEADFEPGNKNSYISDGLFKLCISDEESDISNADIYENLDNFEVTSESIFYGEWIKQTGAKNGNISPELSWEKVNGANAYAIFMVDLDEGDFHIHGYGMTDTNHLDFGELGDEGFLGPIPPEPHNYSVYVFALKKAVETDIKVDKWNLGNEEKLLEILNKDNPGNAIAYGSVTASYEYLERVW
ncbi:MAG: hypothetical protein IKS60_03905 [Lachnospiraceae bacterium]|nr:hypothetical protein [Lachnospiraceae bacterium]MBR4412735.1 hypothetical protein [Lachnospiraceae bacterium]MBR5066137.1 hypothetical protein [Lachnospiraceae bacterium]MBR5918254.1 hypothetical protein [Lachnospiraceae bacterium]